MAIHSFIFFTLLVFIVVLLIITIKHVNDIKALSSSKSRNQKNVVNDSKPVLSNTTNNFTSELERPQDFSSDLGEFNPTIDEKIVTKREDAFEKKPAAESPHAVLLITYYNKNIHSTCSGSLLTTDWVLTAAHCLVPLPNPNVRQIVVYAGGYSLQEVISKNLSVGSQLRTAKSILPHPNYTGAADFDIGLVRVRVGFRVSHVVKPIGISTEPWNHRGYRKCQMTGFGIVQIGEKKADDFVRKTHTLHVKKPCLCSFRLKMMFGTAKVARFLCARPRPLLGVCPGDSGAGLVCNGRIWAVTVLLVPLADTVICQMPLLFYRQCGSPDSLSIFQDSCPFLPWVNSHVRLFKDSQISGECVDRHRGAGYSSLRRTGRLLVVVCLSLAIVIK